MFFAAPIALALLAPWAVVTVWLLRSRRESTTVPFLSLWRGSRSIPRGSRALQTPPLALASALAAILFMIVAAARPMLASSASAGVNARVSIVFDRGLTVSAAGREQALKEVEQQLGSAASVDLIFESGEAIDGAGDWLKRALDSPVNYADTREAVAWAVRQALADDDRVVFAITDHEIPEDPRVIVIRPTTVLRNVGITRFAVSETPRPQAMVRVRNDFDAQKVKLTVRTGKESLEREIDLPPVREERNYFVDLPKLDATALARIGVADDVTADNVAYLVRERAWPRIEVRDSVPPAIARIVEAYARSRPAGEGSARVFVSATPGDTEPTAVVAGGQDLAVRGPIRVTAHAVTAGVDWQSTTLESSETPPGNGWTPVLSSGGRTIVAVREQPIRQVWIGIGSTNFARTPEFVVFWTNVFDWLGGGNAAQFASSMFAAPLGDEWKLVETHLPSDSAVPGIYRRSDGVLQALNIAPLRIEPLRKSDPPSKWAALKRSARPARSLVTPFIFAALACLIVSACVWPGRTLTPFWAARTV